MKFTSKLRTKLLSIAVTIMFYGCSPAATETSEDPDSSGGGTTTSGGTTSGGGFTTGSESTSVTGSSLAALDFTCEATTGIFETLNGILYSGSKLVCTPNLELTGSTSSTTEATSQVYQATVNDLIEVKWTLERYYGNFYLAHTCSIGGDAGAGALTCLFQDRNRAVRSMLQLEVTGPDGETSLHLASTVSGDIAKEISFENECDAAPDDLSEYDSWGDGTAIDPYLWCDKAQFADFRTRAGTNSEALGAYFRIGKNLGDVGGTAFIGSAANPFTGTIQGNGYSFSLSADISSLVGTTGTHYLGLFPYIDGATLDYFVIEKITLSTPAADDPGSADLFIGSLVGYAKDSNISRITINDADTSAVRFVTVPDGGAFGGLVGKTENSQVSFISVDTLGFAITPGEISGGIVGIVDSTSTLSEINVNGLEIVGEYSATTPSTGIIVGENFGTIESVIISGDGAAHGSWVGGVTGKNSGIIQDVSIENLSVHCLGTDRKCGLVVGDHVAGTIQRVAVKAGATFVTNSEFTGSCGGIAGVSSANILNSYTKATLPEVCGITSGPFTSYLGAVVGKITAGTYSNNYSAAQFSTIDAQQAGFAGLVSGGTAVFTSNYWDQTLAPSAGVDTVDATDLTGVDAVTSSALQSLSTFTGWDFTTIWDMESGESPKLR